MRYQIAIGKRRKNQYFLIRKEKIINILCFSKASCLRIVNLKKHKKTTDTKSVVFM